MGKDQNKEVTPQKSCRSIKLYKYRAQGKDWERASSNAHPRFCNAKKDSITSGREGYYLKIEHDQRPPWPEHVEALIDVHVDDGLNHKLDTEERRVTFYANDSIYALKFPSEDACNEFGEQLNRVIRDNKFRYGLDNDDAMADFAASMSFKETGDLFVAMGTDALRNQEGDDVTDEQVAFTPPPDASCITPSPSTRKTCGMAPAQAVAEMEDRFSILNLDQNRTCRYDLRDRKSPAKLQSPAKLGFGSPANDFGSPGTNFTCMAASGKGFVAVGSRDGIRLYNSRVLTQYKAQARTFIPGLGAPVTAIDVTYDGKWVLATTNHYLLLIKTTYVDEKGEEANGFESRMGDSKARPRMLRLKPEDAVTVQVQDKDAKFTKGKFTWITEGGHSERWVVADRGCFSVEWSFTAAAAESAAEPTGAEAKCVDYVLRAKGEEVVEEQAAMVAATPRGASNLA